MLIGAPGEAVGALGGAGAVNAMFGSHTILYATVPGPPRAVSAIAGDRSVTVNWTPPLSDGGSALTGYLVVLKPTSMTVTVTSTTAQFANLTNGTTYTATVTALNLNGAGPVVTANPVTPGSATPPASADYVSVVPARVLDTRPGPGQVGYSGAKPAAGSTVEVQITGVGQQVCPPTPRRSCST